MTAPKPQTIGARLFSQLEVLFQSEEAPSEFQLRRLAAEADQLMGADAGAGLIVKSGIAALRWDVIEARKQALRSVQVDPSIITLMNAALTLKNVSLMDEACEFIERARQRAPQDPVTVESSIVYLMHTGLIAQAADVHKQALNDKVKLPDDLIDAVGYLELIEELGIDLERVHFEVQSVYKVLMQHRKRPRTITYSHYQEPDGGRALVISFGIRGDLTDEMRLESELAQELAEQDGWNPNVLGVEFEIDTENADNAA